jgi:hypothetical protein
MTDEEVDRLLAQAVREAEPNELYKYRFATLVYERAFIDGMQKQMQSSVDKAVNKMAQREWQGLTKDEISNWDLPDSPTVYEFAQFVEAKLKLKNGYAEEKNSGR